MTEVPGPGPLRAGSLVIDTAGEITLAAGNTGFTGSTTLSGTGTVTLAGADSLGSGRVTVNNGVLNLSSLDAANVILITKEAWQTRKPKPPETWKWPLPPERREP